jgi:hypothetical protein
MWHRHRPSIDMAVMAVHGSVSHGGVSQELGAYLSRCPETRTAGPSPYHRYHRSGSPYTLRQFQLDVEFMHISPQLSSVSSATRSCQRARVGACAVVFACSYLRARPRSVPYQILIALPITLAQSLALRTFILDSISTPADTYTFVMF